MTTPWTLHTPETAPDAARAPLAQVSAKYGRVPNLLAAMAESPALLSGYLGVASAFRGSSFSPLEQHVVLQTVNASNACHYCTAAHSAVAVGVTRVDPALDAALRELRPLADPRLEALRRFAHVVTERRGWAEDDEVEAFLAAGYTRAQLLEVVLGIGQKTISNYVNHLIGTPLDAAFAGFRTSFGNRRG
jgi:alkylhydroperoxidase family enzyme